MNGYWTVRNSTNKKSGSQRKGLSGHGLGGYFQFTSSPPPRFYFAIGLAFVLTASAQIDSDLDGGACVPCDELSQKLLVVQGKIDAFDEGMDMLDEARDELQSNDMAADAFAGAYGILGGVSIVVGVATLPCGIDVRWLDSLMGGAAGLGAYVQGGNAGEVSLAALVSYAGFGVVSDSIAYVDFWKQYPEGKEDVRKLEQDLDEAKSRMRVARDRLESQRVSLESWMNEGDCDEANESLESFFD